MDMISPLVDAYALQYTSPEEALMQEINEFTMRNHPQSNMLSGHVQGKLLAFISTILRPKYVLEVGTFVGYSGLYLAQGLSPDGELHTLELREEDAQTARGYFARSEKGNQIHLHTGNALELIPRIDRKWDLVFIDADKTGYIDYYELVVPRLNDRGIILADNVLFHGEVLEEPIKGKNAKAIQAFNEHVKQDPRTEQILLTVRDGLLLIKKK
ncbi:O-methyltransferase [Asinibacterium sp. OR53]|uniref:O-methyltransferase n=1 Tax=Asinibacterium sp. OR53 TaxID=925409 RepID=UPI00047BAB77|nr:O-methyltransferase [Asinibacterium sp. OR53]